MWSDAIERRSALDASVNWVAPGVPGLLEARLVRRDGRKLVVYLSSQTGCRQACRMCHLTATGQTDLRDATPAEILAQADTVLADYRRRGPEAEVVHFNFMARGEPLASAAFLDAADDVLESLDRRALALDLAPRVLVSTILPRTLDRPLEAIFARRRPEVYYSIYSMNDAFRRRWLPKALPVSEGLDLLASWQQHTHKTVKLHYAFIEGENDAEHDVRAICDAVQSRGLDVHVNIVRYNPFDPARHGSEPPEAIVFRNAALFASLLPQSRVKVIGRVGFDVNASCGMFQSVRAR